MQELSLYCLIPNARYKQVLRIFSGICNMNPEPHFVHHLIYKPKRPKPMIMMAASQPEMYYLQLISKIDEAKVSAAIKAKEEGDKVNKEKEMGQQKKDEPDVIMIDADPTEEDVKPTTDKTEVQGEEEKPYDIRRQQWTIRFLDFPGAMGARPVTTRNMYLAEIGDGDALAFMEDLGYTYVSEYVTSGHTLYHNNLIIELTQTLIPTIQHQPLPREALRNIDPAHVWVCEVSLRVAQVGTTTGNKDQLDTTNMGVQELQRFQALLKGVGIELEMGDRLSLDTRVK